MSMDTTTEKNLPQEPPRKPTAASILAPRGNGGQGDSSSGDSYGGGQGMDKKIARKFWTTRRIGMIVGAIAFLALIAWGISSTSGGRRLNVDRDRVTISEVRFAPFQENIPITGNVLPRNWFFLDAIEGGRVEEVFVQEGAILQEGDPILRLSNSGLQLSLLQTETSRIEQINRLEQTRFQVEQSNLSTRQQLTDMQYNIRRLEREHARAKQLYDKELMAEQDYLRIKDEYEYYLSRMDLTQRSYRTDSLRQAQQLEQMADAVARMDQNFQVINSRLENLVIRAPADGRLSQLNAQLGEIVSTGYRFGQVDLMDGVMVRAQVDEFHISRVMRGQKAVTLPIAGQEYEMEVHRVYPQVQQGRFEVDLHFVGEEPDAIRRGQTVRARLEMSDPTEAVVVPLGGFFQSTGGNWIYVLDESGEFAVKQPIRLSRKNLEVYEVVEGLEPGQQVVTSSYETFNEADRLVFN
ncbi:MAG: HlyD family efflux transporter periplasmic adaptor subunit [Rhodothermales bacterium]